MNSETQVPEKTRFSEVRQKSKLGINEAVSREMAEEVMVALSQL